MDGSRERIHSDALKASPYDLEGFWTGSVVAVEGSQERPSISVLPDVEHRDETRFDCVVLGLQLDDGAVVVVGPESATAPDGVRTHPVIDVVGQPPAEGAQYRLTKEVWLTPEQAGLSARELVMGGLSLGGSVTDGFLARSDLADLVDAVILDAPASSLRDMIDEAAEARTLPVVGLPIPESPEDAALLIAGLRFGLDYDAVDDSGMQGLIDVPLLTFQTDEDLTIPKAVNDRFMLEGSGRGGQYVVIPGAGHVLSWNVDPEAYERTVTQFLEQLG